MNLSSSLKWLALSLAAVAGVSQAQVLVKGPVPAVTVQDLDVDAQRIPEQARRQAFAKPETVEQVATNLYLRRAMGAKGAELKLDQDPSVKLALQQARDRILADAYLLKLDAKNQPSEAAVYAKVQSIYKAEPQRFRKPEEARISHILIPFATEGAKDKAEQLLAQLKSGANFEELAKAHSGDPGSAAKGGDLGFFTRGRMVPAFENAAFALAKKGDLSGIVETQFGFHILRLEEKKPAAQLPLDEVKEGLRQEVIASILNEGRNREAAAIRQKMDIDAQAIEDYSATYRR